MDIIQIVVIGIIASILYIILKEINASFAFFLVLTTAILIFLAIIQQIGIIFKMLESLANKANVDGMYMATILKIIGIAYIIELGANLTRDAWISTVTVKIKLAGQIYNM